MAGKTVLLIGVGEEAARKRALLAKTPAILVEAESAEAAPAAAWANAAFVIVALKDEAQAAAAAAQARAAGKPVNVVDRPHLSDFHVPAIVDRGELVISVASGGLAPMLARDARARIEAAIPAGEARLGELARLVAGDVRAAFPDVAQRRAAWERILRGPAAEAARAGDLPRAQALAHGALRGRQAGYVALVGAGPGDPELLTLKALRLLGDADIIFYDRLVDPRILDLARRDAARVSVGKARGAHSVPQEEIHALMMQAAIAGNRVVRLKGGDPFIFGRGGEELEALKAAGVEAFVVPGITAALGCAAAAGVALTHRDHAHAVTFATGHAKAGEAAPDVNWAAFAAPTHTVVIYMGGARAKALAQSLIAGGRLEGTPALIIENGTRPDQCLTPTTLAALAAGPDALETEGPALLIVGEVTAAALEATIAEALRQAA